MFETSAFGGLEEPPSPAGLTSAALAKPPAPSVTIGSLPHFAGDVPTNIVITENSEAVDRLALDLLEIGLVDPLQVDPTASSVSIAGGAMERFIDRHLGTLNHFPLHYFGTDDPREFEMYEPYLLSSRGLPDDAPVFIIAASLAAAPGILPFGSTMRRLLKGQPRPIRIYAAPHKLIAAATRWTPAVYQPEDCIDCARYAYWHGYENEEEAIAEFMEEGVDPDEIGIPTLASLHRYMPRALTKPHPRLTLPDHLDRVCRSSLPADIKDLAQTLHRLVETAHARRLQPFSLLGVAYGHSPNFSVILRHHDQDEMLRVYDDITEIDMNSGESTEVAAALVADLRSRRRLKKSLADLSHMFAILKTLDELLTEVMRHAL